MAHPFLDKVRAKYPGAYDDIPDRELATKLVAKYPTYRPQVADLLAPTVSEVAQERLEGIRAEEQNPLEELGARTSGRFRAGVGVAKDAIEDPGIIKTPLGVLGGGIEALTSPMAGAAGVVGNRLLVRNPLAGRQNPVAGEILEQLASDFSPLPPVAKFAKALRGVRAANKASKLASVAGAADEVAEAAAKAMPVQAKMAVGAGDELPPPAPAAPRAAELPTELSPPAMAETAEALPKLAPEPQIQTGPRGIVPGGVVDDIPTGGGGPPLPPDAPLPKYAGNVNLQRINNSDEILRGIYADAGRLKQRGPLPDVQVKALAEDMLGTVDEADAFARQVRNPDFVARFLSVRNVHNATRSAYKEAIDAYKAAPTPQNFDRLRVAQGNKLSAFQAASDVARSAGLILRSFNIDAEAKMAGRAEKMISALMAGLRTKGALSDDLTRRLAAIDLDNPEQVNQFLRILSTKKASLSDKVYEAYLASILSGPQTHIANFVGNILTSTTEAASRFGAGAVDFAASKITGRAQERFAREGLADFAGMVGGVADGFRAALKTAASEIPASSSTKLETRGPAIGGKIGRVIRAPLTALSVSDEFFKAVNKRGALHAEAVRDGLRRGLKGKDLAAHADNMIANPTGDMLEAAEKASQRRTFQDDPGQWLGKVMEFRQDTPLRWIIPFVKTPANIVKRGLEYSPLGLAKGLRNMAKGVGGESSEQIARGLMGSAAQMWVATQVMDGVITGGGPADLEQRRRLEATGWQPYSVKVGDNYFSYQRLEPFATILGTAADAAEISDLVENEDDFLKLAGAMGLSFAKNLTNKTFVQGFSNAIDAIRDPERKMQQFLGGYAGAVVPGAIAQPVRADDPYLRDARSIIDKARQRIPGVRQEMPAIRDERGEPIPSGAGGFAERLLSPVKRSEVRGGPIEALMVDLGAELPGISRKLNLSEGRVVELSPEQYEQLSILSGQKVDARFKEIEANLQEFTSKPREEQRNAIRMAVLKARDEARKEYRQTLQNDRKAKLKMRPADRIPGARSVTLPPTPNQPQP